MGNCCCCRKDDEYVDLEQPPVEQRRELQREAAEKRLQTESHRGIQDPDKVRRMQERAKELERLELEAAKSGDNGTGLRWQAN